MPERSPATARSEVARFLAVRPPFDALGPEELAELVAETELEFHLAGTTLLTADEAPIGCLRVVYSGAIELLHSDKLLDVLGAGDTLGHAAMLSGLPTGFEARAAEDTLCYRIPVSVAEPLLERVRSREVSVGALGGLTQAVARLIRSPTVLCAPHESAAEVARRMTDTGATCAMVELGGAELGIVTDRDLRTRVVAAGRSASVPVESIMSAPVFAVPPERLAGEVLFELLERGIHHAPVVNEAGRLVGVIEDADLFAAQPRTWFTVRRAIDRASTPEGLAAAARTLPGIVVDLHSANARPLEIARVLSALVDALFARALDIAAGHGAASARVAWVALGSHARRELTAASRPRGVLIGDGADPPVWRGELSAVLAACSLPSEVAVVDARAGHGVRRAEVIVERRLLWGAPGRALPMAGDGEREAVLSALAERARVHQPPTGFDGDQVLERDGRRGPTLDIRARVIAPVVELGRWAGAVAGLVQGSTTDRLAAAAAHGVLSSEDAQILSEAFEVAFSVRLAHHAELLSAGQSAGDLLDTRALSPLTRDGLRDVFRAVAGVQRRLWP